MQNRMQRRLGQRTGTCFQRCVGMDAINSLYSVTYDIDTKPLSYVAEGTQKDDVVKIGVGAAAGAVIGAITGGKKGAAIGSAVGAGAGTGVVLATDGKEIRLAEGRKLTVSLTNPLTIRTK